MKTSSAKAKGRKLQQYVCRILTSIFKWDEGDAESRSMGSAGVDCILSPRARTDFPFSIECKNTKMFPSVSALEQSKANKKHGTYAAVVWKPPGKSEGDSIIYFNLEEFALLWREHTCQNQK